MKKILRIGTRDSQLAVWQATLVQNLLKESGTASELVYIKSEGDIDTITPLYALGVTGIFTKTLDAALLNNRIDLAVHSMKDVPTQMAQGIQQAAVLKRGSHKDIFVPHPDLSVADAQAIFGMGGLVTSEHTIIKKGSKTKETSRVISSVHTGDPVAAIIATSSIRRIAQWRRRYPQHQMENLRGNVNTRLRKLKESNWSGAIFAAAGLERINLRPENSIDLDWMLPAPAQGAIMVVCRQGDDTAFQSCQTFNDAETALCTKIEKDFLHVLMGGCSTPISALAEVQNGHVVFKGQIMSPDSFHKAETTATLPFNDAASLGFDAAKRVLTDGGQAIMDHLRNKETTNNGTA